jgi:hypothetical protein
MRNFLGHDGFIWWIGVVEDINDPLTLGRCKVRCFGYHPAKKTDLVPTVDLPWALTIHPLNTPNLYGAPALGDWVFGFFLDSLSAQEPAILGYLPAIPVKALDYFGTESSATRNFASVTNRSDIVWQTTKMIRIDSNNEIQLQSNTININSSNNVTISSNTKIDFLRDPSGESTPGLRVFANTNCNIQSNLNLVLEDREYKITLAQLMREIEGEGRYRKDNIDPFIETLKDKVNTIKERIDDPATTLLPNTSITVITDI